MEDMTETEQLVKEIFGHWLAVLSLAPITVRYKFVKKQPKDRSDLFTVRCGHPYKSVKLDCYPDGLSLPIQSLELALLHEALHVLHTPVCNNRLMAEQIYVDIMEEFIDTLAHCVYDALPKAEPVEPLQKKDTKKGKKK